MQKDKRVNRIWGTARGCGGTKDAAPGAFCWREYPVTLAMEEAVRDFQVVIIVEKNVVATPV